MDPVFAAVHEALASYASDPDDPPLHDGDRVQAAVAVVLRGRSSLELLLIKRAEHPGDPWSGHMALPGGRRDDHDASLRQTAVRETREETAVDLAGAAALGRLEVVAPVSRRLPRLTISPYVFGVAPGTAARAASREVDRTLWVPLSVLRDPATRDRVEIDVPGGPRPFPCYRIEGEVVWGLTYRILGDFLRRFPDSALPERA